MKRLLGGLLVGFLLLAVMVAGLLGHLQRETATPAFDSNVAVDYSREYGLALTPEFGGAQQTSKAIAWADRLEATVDEANPGAQEVKDLLAEHRRVLRYVGTFPDGPRIVLDLLVGGGGGAAAQRAAAAGEQIAFEGVNRSAQLSERAHGVALHGLGFAPSAASMRDYWALERQKWDEVEALMAEARHAYGSFWSKGPTVPLADALNLTVEQDSVAFAVPARHAEGLPLRSADWAALARQAAEADGRKATLSLARGAAGELAFCVEVDAVRHCPVWGEALHFTVNAPQALGVFSPARDSLDDDQRGGRLGIFNPNSRASAGLLVEVEAVDGAWNATASFGPVPADGGRYAYFDALGEGLARVHVTSGGAVLLDWVGESVPGLGLMLE